MLRPLKMDRLEINSQRYREDDMREIGGTERPAMDLQK
jgi:hypothetical protein